MFLKRFQRRSSDYLCRMSWRMGQCRSIHCVS